ncbi:MAG: GNAT family N-acetyltransferase [Anaerolineaceae bacterium]|nr:GNAT family N-acetyltransferase [Anaerolineaceae bacterium]
MQLSTHPITLPGRLVTLRPMSEADWPVLLRWNSDPEVLYYSAGDDNEPGAHPQPVPGPGCTPD